MKRRIPLVDLSRQHRPLRRSVARAMGAVIARGAFILGSEVREFESAFARYCGASAAVGVDNGSSALELILRAMGVGRGDEVIVPAMTFVATASAVRIVGAKPVPVDVDAETGSIDVDAALDRVRRATKAIIPVHLHGRPAAAEELRRRAGGRVRIVEDCCQGHGGRSGKRRVGSLGHAAAFSFYPSKNLGCFGDGGMVVTADAGIARAVRELRNYGERGKHNHRRQALNRRLDTIQAAVLGVKLARLDRWNAERRRAAALYRRALAGTSVLPPPDAPGHVYHVFAVRSRRRDRLAAHLRREGIETGVHYPRPIHLLPVFRDLGYRRGSFPAAERFAAETLSLPLFPGITVAEVARVAAAVRRFEASR